MVAATTGTLEVRPVGAEAFDDVYPLLLEFGNTNLTAHDWRRMLFDYAWPADPQRGLVLYADGDPVGFMGTIFSERRIGGRTGRVCNASSWIVRESHRTASILLLKHLLALRDCTILNLTPTKRSYDIFAKLGFRELERRQLHFLPDPLTLGSLASGRFTAASDSVRTALNDDERTIYRDLGGLPHVAHVVLDVRGQSCYVVATPLYRKSVKLAHVHYIGDRKLFFANQALAFAAFARTMGAVGFVLDERIAEGFRVGPSIGRATARSYRPARPDITPLMIDSLYSELMVHERL